MYTSLVRCVKLLPQDHCVSLLLLCRIFYSHISAVLLLILLREK
jgi:hypothetical protein